MVDEVKRGVKQLIRYAIGIALCVIVGRTLSIMISNSPVFVDIDFGFTIMTVYAYLFGPVAGVIMFGLGRIIEDLAVYGSVCNPVLLLASIFMGLSIGLFVSPARKKPNVQANIFIKIAVILGIYAALLIGVYPLFCSFISRGVSYSARLNTGFYFFLANSFNIIILGLPLGKLFEKIKLRQRKTK